jgi:hypothetical protein
MLRFAILTICGTLVLVVLFMITLRDASNARLSGTFVTTRTAAGAISQGVCITPGLKSYK